MPSRVIMAAMGTIAIPGGTIGVSRSGDGDAMPLVFLHGVGSDKSVWRPQLDHFGKGRPCYAFDYPGYGESSPVAVASRDDFARAILDAMSALGVERAHVCGLSLGGVIAIAMHAAAPDRCASLILADTFAVHPDGQAIHDRAIAASSSMSMRALAEARAPLLLGKDAGENLVRNVIDTMGRIDPQAYRIGAEAVWLADQRDRVSAIRVPTLILVGDEDSITPPALSTDLRNRIAGSSTTIIKRSGHLANIEQPEAFNAAINDHLMEIE
jgi:3-oxoadipate enol-lactonase